MVKKFIFFLFSAVFASQSFGQMELSWTLVHAKTKKNIPFGVKGSVQESLIQANELPDPFVGKNEDKFSWIEDFSWEVFSSFNLTEDDFKNEIDIEFPSVDTYAKIYLNDQLIGETNNSYITYRYDIKTKSKLGKNSIRVIFVSPVSYQKNRLKDVGTKLPAPNDVGKIQVSSLCRKPQYQFGWDWSLRMTTMGFWKPAKVIKYSRNRVIGKNIQTIEIKEKSALQSFSLLLEKEVSDSLIWDSYLFGEQYFTKVKGLNSISRIETIENPKLWWPRGQGLPNLYKDHWKITDSKGTIIYEADVNFGVRKSELIQEKDQWGTSYLIKINGRPVFCKGADYIPDDIFPARISSEKVKNNIQTMIDCNFNMVRVWGGGFYPNEEFYEQCDSLGLMVWQDFMFACAMYPGNDEFIANVQREFDEQIPRMASHPSVVLFNGNNEVDVAWKNWGFKITYALSPKDSRLIESYYDRLFKQVLPDAITNFSSVPYVHTSPLSNWGKDEYYNSGSQHYWGVWHGKDPIEDFGRKSGRFNAEYGFQSFPEYSTLAQFSSEKDWKLDSPVMKAHQKSYVGNGMIAKHSDILFGKASDFKRFVYYSQLTQAKAVSIAIVSHRTSYPRCTGTLFWQFNDCWPAPTWSSIDYYGQWKALQYQVKEDFKDVTFLEKQDTLGKSTYFFISDVPDGFLAKLSLFVYDFQGEKIDSFFCQRTVLQPSSIEVFKNELLRFKNGEFVFHFSAEKDGIVVSDRKFFIDGNPKNDNPRCYVSVKGKNINGNLKKGQIEITTDTFIKDFWISSKTLGVHFEQNFLNLLPGTHIIEFHYISDWNESDLEWQWR